MRNVQLRYRVLRTDLMDGDQWYFGSTHESTPNGMVFEDREVAERWAYYCTAHGLIADVEEYEIP